MLHFSIHFYEKEDTLSTYAARDKTRINIIKTLLKKSVESVIQANNIVFFHQAQLSKIFSH